MINLQLILILAGNLMGLTFKGYTVMILVGGIISIFCLAYLIVLGDKIGVMQKCLSLNLRIEKRE